MQTKLTLRMDEDLIRFAKSYAKKTGKSVSRMISDYFALLQAGQPAAEEELSPLVRSLKGALRGANLEEGDYRRYLEGKYL